MSNLPNPFGDYPPNPYAAPSFVASDNGPPVSFSRDEARLRLLGPAIGLAIFSLLWLGYWVFVLIVMAVDGDLTPEAGDPAEFVGTLIGMALALGLFTLPGLVSLFGAVQMFRVKMYGACWAACICGVLPCTCVFLAIPFGIWGMVVLSNPRVKLAFRQEASPFATK